MTRHPRWTRARLARVLGARFGWSRRGGVDTRAVAAAMGVSQRTVQRWLHASGRQKAPIPAARLEQLRELLEPTPVHVRRQQQQALYAATALRHLQSRAPLEAWTRQGWLEEHRVAIVEDHHKLVRRIVSGRRDAEEFDSRRSGRILAHVVVPTRFHAQMVIDLVLAQVQEWRVDLHRSKSPATTTWFADAPPVDLAALTGQVVHR
jgi:transposase